LEIACNMRAALLAVILALSTFQLAGTYVASADQLPFPEVPRPTECTRYVPDKDEVRAWILQHQPAARAGTPTLPTAELESIPSGAPINDVTAANLAATLRDWTACNNAASNFAVFTFATESLLIKAGWPALASSGDMDATLDGAVQTQAFLAQQFEGDGNFSTANAIWNVFGGRRLADGRIGVFVLWGELLAHDGKETGREERVDFIVFLKEGNQYFADDVFQVGKGCFGVGTEGAAAHLGDICG
jgi:hypothetical protein